MQFSEKKNISLQTNGGEILISCHVFESSVFYFDLTLDATLHIVAAGGYLSISKVKLISMMLSWKDQLQL